MREETEQDYRARMLRVLVHIQDHLDEAISLEELAAVAHFSPYHFHRIFRGLVGESVMGHVRRLRLERAAHRLRYLDATVTQVAFEAGYETHEAFTRAFAAVFGVPPSQFREQRRTSWGPSAPSEVYFTPSDRPIRHGANPLDVRIERLAVRVAFMRHLGPYGDVGQTWGRLFAWAGSRGLITRGTRILGVVHDDPEVTPPDKVRYDACITVDDGLQPGGEVGVQALAGEYALTSHVGPYETLGDTCARLCGECLPASGRELKSAPAIEIYRNSPRDTRPDELLTDIYLPVRPESRRDER
jgi:AraC family transcriptional regulator